MSATLPVAHGPHYTWGEIGLMCRHRRQYAREIMLAASAAAGLPRQALFADGAALDQVEAALAVLGIAEVRQH